MYIYEFISQNTLLNVVVINIIYSIGFISYKIQLNGKFLLQDYV